MNYFNRIARADFSWILATAVFIAACSESAPPPPVTQEVVKLTPEQAFATTLKKAESGDVVEQSNLGLMYLKGEGVARDTVKAVEWFQKAGAQGDAAAQYNLGFMYILGEGVAKDAVQAVEWYQKAAAQGHAAAQSFLGAMYFEGNGVAKDAVKAVEWYQKAAAQGYASAQYNLGAMYADGHGVAKDAVKAVEWYQKAAAQGDTDAQYSLGLRYGVGEGVTKDAVKAVEWYQKAAPQGHTSAQNNLGVMYAKGEGVTKDMVLAYAWFNIAAASGDKNSLRMRGIAESELSANGLAEAQRLSSSWKKGQVLVREGKAATSATTPLSPGALSKQGTGTAFIVGKTGHAITNHHVVDGCKEVRAEGRDGLVKLITSDAVNDIALIQVPGTVSATAAINADPAKLRQGEDIVVFGFPLNAVLSSGGNLTPGVVSALTGLGNNTNQIQITAPIQPGSSGSPVLNKKGEVVGVVSMKLSDSKMAKATGSVGQNVNFAVSGQTLKTFLDTHKVDYSKGGFMSFDKSTADLADEAKKWTMVVECWK